MEKNNNLPVLSIETKKIKEVLNLCSMAVSKSPNDPYIIMHVRMSFDFKERLIYIQSTNLKQGLSTKISFDFKEDDIERNNFVCCVPHKEISKIVSICSEESFKVMFKDENMLIKYGNSNHSIPVMTKESKDFPVWKKVADDAPVILINDKESEFCDFIKKISTISTNLEIEDATCYVGIECKDGMVSLSVTDKFILSVIDFYFKCSKNFNTILIPKDAVNFIHKIFSGELIKVIIGNEFIIVKSKEIEIFILLSKTKPFDIIGMYEKISSRTGSYFSTTKESLEESLKSVSIVNDICLLENKKESIVLTTENKEFKQKANSKIDCDVSNFNEQFNFSINNFNKILNILKGSTVKITLSDTVVIVDDVENPNIKNLFGIMK